MNVDEAKAQLALAKASQNYRESKAAYREDESKRAEFVEARDELVAVRDDWRNNWRTAPDEPGDATAAPDPASVSLEMN